MKMLYMPCHSIHEYDDIRLFEELGIDIFSHGAYLDPTKCDDPMRPSLPPSKHWLGCSHPEYIDLARKHSKEYLCKELIDPFDVIYIIHMPRWIHQNWENFRGKIVIWRTNGQSCRVNEKSLEWCREEGLKIVRYSPAEWRIPGFIGGDAMIRFYKDPAEYGNWNGDISQVITLVQNMKARGVACGFDHFVNATEGFPRKLYGPHNENSGVPGGFLSFDEMTLALQYSRCYFYAGTMPACYTLNFIEAWMTGIPIVAIGPGLGNPVFLPGQFTYEIQDLIENGRSGFVSDDIGELRAIINVLLREKHTAQAISEAGRARAIELFGKESVKATWKEFFATL